MKKLKLKQKSHRSGFTLVELVIVIAIVIILSVISVPIYRGYVDKSKWAEGYALVGTLLSAEKAYYSEHGNFYGASGITSFSPVLGIDARGNKYFTNFWTEAVGRYERDVHMSAVVPQELKTGQGGLYLRLAYNITLGLYNASNNPDYIDVGKKRL